MTKVGSRPRPRPSPSGRGLGGARYQLARQVADALRPGPGDQRRGRGAEGPDLGPGRRRRKLGRGDAALLTLLMSEKLGLPVDAAPVQYEEQA
ncbi:hypothetical protein ACRAWD_21845 [Caulobacter segnis]